MAGFARMNKEGGCAGAGECGGQLAPDMTGFAHAGDHNAAAAGEQGVTGNAEGGGQALEQGVDGVAFHADGAAGRGYVVKIGHGVSVVNR